MYEPPCKKKHTIIIRHVHMLGVVLWFRISFRPIHETEQTNHDLFRCQGTSERFSINSNKTFLTIRFPVTLFLQASCHA